MANRHLLHAGHGTQEGGQVVAVQVVAGVQLQAFHQRRIGRRGEASQHSGVLGRAMRSGVAFGVKLDTLGAQLAHSAHRSGQRVHEQADPHAERLCLRNQRRQHGGVLRKLPAMVGRGLVHRIGHEGALVQGQATPLHLSDHLHQVVQRVAFDVDFGLRPVLHQRGQIEHIVGADVALVRPRVHRDAVGTRLQRQRGRPGHARDAQRALVAQQGHLVQVDRQRGMPAMRIEAGGEQGVHGRRGFEPRSPATAVAAAGNGDRLCKPSITCRVRNTDEPR